MANRKHRPSRAKAPYVKNGHWRADLNGCETSHGMPIVVAANGHLVATSASRDPKRVHLLAAAPAMKIAIEDAIEWLKTGEVDGVHYDPESIVASLAEVLHKADGDFHA